MKNHLARLCDKMILSASGWRSVFTRSGDEEDHCAEIDADHTNLAVLIGETFAQYMQNRLHKPARIVVGMDSRPTGKAICDALLHALIAKNMDLVFLGITAAPEIMAFAKTSDAFVYVSASHNPIGHNGIKFGFNDGGVLPASEAAVLIADFRLRCSAENAEDQAQKIIEAADKNKLAVVYEKSAHWKKQACQAYTSFTKEVIADSSDVQVQNAFFSMLSELVAKRPLGIVCDMNGSARSISIDNAFFTSLGIDFYAINNTVEQIVHAIIPEPENLVFCAQAMKDLQQQGKTQVLLGYMPDCDGDRGNIVYWNARSKCAEILRAQEVFALSVLAETAFLYYSGKAINAPLAIAVNDSTSLRIEEIAQAFNAKVFRAEVGEANVVNLARKLRQDNFTVRILGEGSNGGNITHPAAVRDPLNTLFSLIKLLVLRDEKSTEGTVQKKGLFHLWCEHANRMQFYRDDFTLADIIASLPAYTSTGVSDPRAVAAITQIDHARLKAAYQTIFVKEWAIKQADLQKRYNLFSWEAVANNGTIETHNLRDFSLSARGGLKILLKDANNTPVAFLWMRGSGTEPVFRVMCDVKGNNPAMEQELLAWHTNMLLRADTR